MAWGESTAPTATVHPARSATVRIGESARTTTTEVRSQSVSRMATAVTGPTRPPERETEPMRAARTHASGEFHATSTCPASSASTWRS